MGTSTRNSGQSGHNPLIPTWIKDDLLASKQEETQPSGIANPHPDFPQTPIPSEGDPNRFRGPRASFTHYTSGGGRNSALMRKGISNYIGQSLGGSKNATIRLGSSRGSTARLYRVLHTLSGSGGLQKIARFLSLDTLKGLTASDFFIRLADFVCPDGGSEDEGIARSAYYDVVADNPEIMQKPTESLSKEEIDSVLQKYMSKVVMQQVMNGIANKAISFTESLEKISHIEDVVEQFISQSVSDACAHVKQENITMTNERAREITDTIYHNVFEILEGTGD